MWDIGRQTSGKSTDQPINRSTKYTVGITGGIGSGKTVVCRIFETLGIPVFYADEAARYIMEHDTALITQIKALFGEAAYEAGRLNRSYISAAVFSDPAKRMQLNAITHPATIQYGRDWLAAQQTPYAIKEAALFFESGSYKDIDFMVGVAAPLETRIRRAMQRDGILKEDVEKRIASQMSQEEKMQRCDRIIKNDDLTALIPQVILLHNALLRKLIR